jgi:hypothetical protein
MNVGGEDCSADERIENIGKQEIGHGVQLISSGQMAGDLHTQFAQMLHRAPHLGAGCAELFGDALAADDDGRVVAQQAHDAAETRVG